MKDLHEKMTSLDDFVTRARSQNAQHHGQHAGALESLSETVENSYEKIGSHFKTTFTRVQDLGSEMDEDIEAVRGSLEPLPETLCRPLAELREDIGTTVLQEYNPTGETPRKMDYQFPTELPRTRPHDTLIAKFNGAPSPSKGAATNNAPTATVFSDADPSLPENRSPTRPYSSDHGLPLPDNNQSQSQTQFQPRRGRSSLLGGLREVNPNVNSTTTNHDARANAAAIHGFSASLGPGMGAGVSVGANSEEEEGEAAAAEDFTLPLPKKSRTTSTSTRGSTRSGGGGGGGKKALSAAGVLEGRENMGIPLFASVVPGAGPEVFSQSISRRKSPRLN